MLANPKAQPSQIRKIERLQREADAATADWMLSFGNPNADWDALNGRAAETKKALEDAIEATWDPAGTAWFKLAVARGRLAGCPWGQRRKDAAKDYIAAKKALDIFPF